MFSASPFHYFEHFNTYYLLHYSSNGPEWWRLRSAFQHSLSRIQDVRVHLPGTDQVISAFIAARLPSIQTKDFLEELSRLFLECK